MQPTEMGMPQLISHPHVCIDRLGTALPKSQSAAAWSFSSHETKPEKFLTLHYGRHGYMQRALLQWSLAARTEQGMPHPESGAPVAGEEARAELQERRVLLLHRIILLHFNLLARLCLSL